MPVWTEQTELPLLVSPAAAGSSPVPAAQGDERPGTAVRCGDGASAGRAGQYSWLCRDTVWSLSQVLGLFHKPCPQLGTAVMKAASFCSN